MTYVCPVFTCLKAFATRELERDHWAMMHASDLERRLRALAAKVR